MKSVILDYAIERKEKRQVVYQYDFTESLNVVTIANNISYLKYNCSYKKEKSIVIE